MVGDAYGDSVPDATTWTDRDAGELGLLFAAKPLELACAWSALPLRPRNDLATYTIYRPGAPPSVQASLGSIGSSVQDEGVSGELLSTMQRDPEVLC